jgi:hypothetical protein
MRPEVSEMSAREPNPSTQPERLPDNRSAGVVQVTVVFVCLVVAGVGLAVFSAYWDNDGAEALGYIGGGMFGAALAYYLLEMSRLGHGPRLSRGPR